jgi:fructosamine-3-kinase
MLPENTKKYIENRLSDNYDNGVEIRQVIPVVGGSINECYKLVTNNGLFFLKKNHAKKYPGMFEAEYNGLKTLTGKSKMIIPMPLFYFSQNDSSFLVTEFVERGTLTADFWNAFAEQLAVLHRNTHSHYGLDYDNYIGSLPQINSSKGTWEEFFIVCRIEPMLKSACDKKIIEKGIFRSIEKAAIKAVSIFPQENPSLLHGDLWAGNFFASHKGTPCVFDPAIYYGHREVDIAMTKLFGGFDNRFYEQYNEYHPMENGWEERMDAANLYPLLVHLNLFGLSYLNQINSIIKRF